MAFDLATWKKQAAERLRGFKREAASRAPGSIYATLCAMSIWPAIQAAQTGDFGAAAAAAFGVAANVGANLVANNFQKWKDEAEAAMALEAEAAKDAETRKALDKILAAVEAPREAQTSLSEADKKWFVDTLLKDVKALGSTLNVTINTGGGAYYAGPINVGRDHIEGDQINVTLIEKLTIMLGGRNPSEERGWLASYLRYVIADCSGLNLQAIVESATRVDRDIARREPPKLSDVYVDLDTTLGIPAEIQSLADFLKQAVFFVDSGRRVYVAKLDKPPQNVSFRPASVLEVLAHHREMVLLGKPGSGKSTFASFVSLNLARAASGDEDGLKALGERWTHGVLLPVRVILREFAQFMVESKAEGASGDIWSFVRSSIHSKLGKHEADLIEHLAKRSGAVFVFDGLDEASSPDIRHRVLTAVEDFKHSAHPQSRFLITSRPYAWGPPDPPRGVYEVADLNSAQIKSFIWRWYDALVNWGWLRRDDADERRDHLVPACERPDLLPLAENPLLLTLMATLTANGIRLPDARAELYATMVELLMNRWNQRFGKEPSLVQQLAMPGLTIASFRSVLEEIAFDAHAAHEGKAGTADIEAWDLLRAFRNLLGSLDKAQLVVNYVDERAGLLIALGERKNDGAGKSKYTFPHRTFQEFLAGCYLARQIDFNERVCALAATNATHWRLALAFAASRANTERGSSAADALVHSEERSFSQDAPAVSVDDGWRAMIAADQLLELGLPEVNRSEQGRKIKLRVATWLAGAMRGTLQPKERAEAGRLVAQLGDPRPGVLTVEDMPMCYVPPGEFIFGDMRILNAGVERPLTMDQGFWIGKYPVTNAQYQQFVSDNGYGQQEFWAAAIRVGRWNKGAFRDWHDEWRKAPSPDDGALDIANHPVVGVSWFEAMAFASWLGARFRIPGLGLPTEAEWEYAARGPRYLQQSVQPLIRPLMTLRDESSVLLTSGVAGTTNIHALSENHRSYPWGEGADTEKMNIQRTRIGNTCAVGIFPAGASIFGCEDLCGNVWEWTTTAASNDIADKNQRDYLGGLDVADMRRVLRGGAFISAEHHARCSNADSDDPSAMDPFVGFRIALPDGHNKPSMELAQTITVLDTGS